MIKEFIIDYIQREYTVPAEVDIMTLNYVEEGYVDSLGFVQFIAILEDEFDVQFSEADLNNPNIKVVGKLIAIVEDKQKQ